MRTCTGCGAVKPKQDLVRVALGKEGTILPDPGRKTGGRGAYLCPKKSCLLLALKRGGLARTLKVKVTEDMVRDLKEEAVFQ